MKITYWEKAKINLTNKKKLGAKLIIVSLFMKEIESFLILKIYNNLVI